MLGRMLREHTPCDGCGSRSFARAEWFRHGATFRYDDGEVVELYFCGHCWNKHKDALSRIVGVYLIDETEFILES